MALPTVNNQLSYRGYTAKVAVDTDVRILRGQVIDIKDTITFEGDNLDSATKDFHRAIDEYLAFCQELGQNPDQPFSGKFVLRISPDMHRTIYLAARKANKSVNDWLEDAARAVARKELSDSPGG